ncbi:MAG: adenosylcobinamide-GDP ribazoletransferase [Chloroflexi bacterium]|nr:MAG: adenosylcobinamide-GDP ribazoletransferase [Chloroflexota bacterium]
MSRSPISNHQSPIANPQSPISHFALAWGLLTVLPFPFKVDTSGVVPGRAAGWFPLVGLLMGGVLAAVGWALYAVLPAGLAAALTLAVWVALTGMLHLDGFMDSCDGLLPPRDPARRLEIMKDSRVGAFGVVGGVLLLLVKFNALAALPPAVRLPVLVLAPALARGAMVWAMFRYPTARPGGMGQMFRQGMGRREVVLALLTTFLPLFLLLPWPVALVVAAVCWLLIVLVARLAIARIHGLTGDVYGAVGETVEAGVLVAVVAAASWPWLAG